MMDQKVWIILAVVMGTLVLLLAVTLALFCAKRSKKKIRGFSLRAVTPLDDAEFESWRRPSQYTKRPEKYGIRPSQPAIVRSTQTPNMFETNMFEKELSIYNSPRTPTPPQHEDKTLISPSTPIKKPERARRKSSVCSSLADRPPTPYSPTSTTGEFPRRGSHTSRRSGSTPHIHYPSMSETSAFDFKFESEDDYLPRGQPRRSHQSDRPLSYSYAHYGESV